MSRFQRIIHVHTKRADFHVHTQRADFPICLEVAFGLQPRECQGALRHSGSPPPSRLRPRLRGGTAEATAPRRPGSVLSPQPCAAPHLGQLPPWLPPHAGGAGAARKAHICSPPPRPAVPAPHRIVVVCLCLLKLGREKGLTVKAAWNARPGPADSSVSKLRKQAGRAGMRPRSAAVRPAQEHTVAEGKLRACRQDRGPFCVEANLPSLPLSAAWGPDPLDRGQSQVGSADFLTRPRRLVPKGERNGADFLETDATPSFPQRQDPWTPPLLQ